MVDAAFAALKEAGLSVRHIRREKYISSRWALAGPGVVEAVMFRPIRKRMVRVLFTICHAGRHEPHGE